MWGLACSCVKINIRHYNVRMNFLWKIANGCKIFLKLKLYFKFRKNRAGANDAESPAQQGTFVLKEFCGILVGRSGGCRREKLS